LDEVTNISRTTSEARLKSGEPMWEWQGDLPTMVGVLPRGGEARDVRWFKGPSRNTLHFLNASDNSNKVTMELPVSDEERSPPHIKRWTFDLSSKSDGFGEEVISRSNGVLARVDDRYLSLPYRYGYVGHNDAERPYDTAAGGNRAGRVTNTYKRFDLQNPTAPESTFFVGNVQSLQESGFVPRQGSTAEGDGYLMGVASNYAEMASELHIVDAQRMEEGAIAAAACLPVALAVATPAVGETAPRATLTDWHIDDMWGVYPRPSEPICRSSTRDSPRPLAPIDAYDVAAMSGAYCRLFCHKKYAFNSSMMLPSTAPPVSKPPSSTRWKPTTLTVIGRIKSAASAVRRAQRNTSASAWTTPMMMEM
jgi:hypothetical protein